ncbi:MAG: guanylate kinase [Kiritimatiellia bacterium]
MSSSRKPLLIVVSAASGAGKSSLCRELLARRPDVVYSVSCTTRAPRGGEIDGQSYCFLSTPAFEQRVAAGDFLEYAEVHGNWYGTLRRTVEDAMRQGRSVIMDIDVQGAKQVRDALVGLPADHMIRRGFVDVFIHAPSMDELRRRLEQRGEDAPDVIEKRLTNAQREEAAAPDYRYRIVNDDFGRALEALLGIIDKERST